jgi:hypothetical protein
VELDAFVTETLLEIANGLAAANNAIRDEKAKPDLPMTFSLRPGSQNERGAGIDFDVAVTTKLEGKGRASGKLKLAVVEAELGGGGSSSKEHVSRIKFTVCVGQWVG